MYVNMDRAIGRTTMWHTSIEILLAKILEIGVDWLITKLIFI